jgi:hypothetical protein
MAHTVQDRDRSRTILDELLAERDHCQQRYESAMGTSCEMSAYIRLRRIREQASACERELDDLLLVY